MKINTKQKLYKENTNYIFIIRLYILTDYKKTDVHVSRVLSSYYTSIICYISGSKIDDRLSNREHAFLFSRFILPLTPLTKFDSVKMLVCFIPFLESAISGYNV